MPATVSSLAPHPQSPQRTSRWWSFGSVGRNPFHPDPAWLWTPPCNKICPGFFERLKVIVLFLGLLKVCWFYLVLFLRSLFSKPFTIWAPGFLPPKLSRLSTNSCALAGPRRQARCFLFLFFGKKDHRHRQERPRAMFYKTICSM